MPVRDAIHSSEVSTKARQSSLVMTRSGKYAPTPSSRTGSVSRGMRGGRSEMACVPARAVERMSGHRRPNGQGDLVELATDRSLIEIGPLRIAGHPDREICVDVVEPAA